LAALHIFLSRSLIVEQIYSFIPQKPLTKSLNPTFCTKWLPQGLAVPKPVRPGLFDFFLARLLADGRTKPLSTPTPLAQRILA